MRFKDVAVEVAVMRKIRDKKQDHDTIQSEVNVSYGVGGIELVTTTPSLPCADTTTLPSSANVQVEQPALSQSDFILPINTFSLSFRNMQDFVTFSSRDARFVVRTGPSPNTLICRDMEI